jgi:hypothetical protein
MAIFSKLAYFELNGKLLSTFKVMSVSYPKMIKNNIHGFYSYFATTCPQYSLFVRQILAVLRQGTSMEFQQILQEWGLRLKTAPKSPHEE